MTRQDAITDSRRRHDVARHPTGPSRARARCLASVDQQDADPELIGVLALVDAGYRLEFLG
jgi:hypothetical protein